MALTDRPLRTTVDVEQAVLDADPTDRPLAFGAGVLANSASFTFLGQMPALRRAEHNVLGVTAASVDEKGRASCRTVAFGSRNPTFVANVHGYGMRGIIDNSATDNELTREVVAGIELLRRQFAGGRPSHERVLGGIATVADIPHDLVATRPFMTTGLIGFLEDSPAARLLARSQERSEAGGEAARGRLRGGMLVALLHGVYERADPVAVERPFVPEV
jgi:hypothetical protein